jgi:hypothetical protein
VRGWFGAIVLTLIAIPSSTLFAQTAQPTSTPNPTLDARARAIPAADVTELFKGIFLAVASQQLTYDETPADKMPSNETYSHYAGKGSDEKYHIWVHIDRQHLNEVSYMFTWWQNPASSPYLIMFAADSGSAGPIWKSRYDAAPNKLEFASVAQRALELQHDRTLSTAAKDLGVLRSLRIGTLRSTIYTTLKLNDMIAFNSIFNPGKPSGPNGCRYDETKALSYWPTLNEPLPTNGCPNLPRSGPAIAPKSPSVYIDVTTDYNFGCGTSAHVRLDFSDDDKLAKVDESPPQRVCM